MYMYMYNVCKGILTCIRIGWSALKQYSSGSIAERAVDHITVPSDPTNVSNTSIDLTRLVVKVVL